MQQQHRRQRQNTLSHSKTKLRGLEQPHRRAATQTTATEHIIPLQDYTTWLAAATQTTATEHNVPLQDYTMWLRAATQTTATEHNIPLQDYTMWLAAAT